MSLHLAPFAEGGPAGIDEEVCRKLIQVALSRGGDYADLFFEYRASASLSFEEGITRSASRSVGMGLGVRVLRGDSTGYAHVEDLSWDAMRRAADTAARIAEAEQHVAPVALARISTPQRYELTRPSLSEPGLVKRKLLERTQEAALKADSRVQKVEASFSEEVREILIATSTGQWVRDVQPLMRFGVRVIVEKDGRRESGRSGGGGRTDLGYFSGKSPEQHAEAAVKQALILLDARAPRE